VESEGLKEQYLENFEEFFQRAIATGDKRESWRLTQEPMYRGEGSDKRDLIPVALREDKLKSNLEREQVNHELVLLERMWRKLYREGYQMAIGKDTMRRYFLNDGLIPEDMENWIPKDLAELVAFGQHHGMPTRLLDFTRDKWVAMRFAAESALRRNLRLIEFGKDIKNERIALWEMQSQFADKLKKFGIDMPLKRITPNYTMNPNAFAQQGVLLHWEVSAPFDCLTDKRSLNKKISDFLQEYEFHYEPVLTKFTIPATDCAKILKRLNQFGYTASKLFPGGEGILKEIKEEDAIQRFESMLG